MKKPDTGPCGLFPAWMESSLCGSSFLSRPHLVAGQSQAVKDLLQLDLGLEVDLGLELELQFELELETEVELGLELELEMGFELELGHELELAQRLSWN